MMQNMLQVLYAGSTYFNFHSSIFLGLPANGRYKMALASALLICTQLLTLVAAVMYIIHHETYAAVFERRTVEGSAYTLKTAAIDNLRARPRSLEGKVRKFATRT
jgi:hypothetical protein